jgi:hypothetical protein
VIALPEGATPADLTPWFAPGGWVLVEVLHGRRVVEAALVHDQRRLEALLEA